MVDKIAPTLKSLGLAFDRLTPVIRKIMPQYQIMDAEQWLNTLTQLDKDWQLVLKGSSKTSVKVDENRTTSAITSAKASSALFNSSLQIAEASIASKSDCMPEKKKKDKPKQKKHK